MTETVHILHVEDNPAFADVTATYLQREDDRFAITSIRNVQAAQDHLRAEPVDCIVSDYDLPDKNGIDLLRTVRDEFQDLPFILFTDKGSEEVASDAISSGVTDYLQKEGKSDKFKLLANRITTAVENYRTQHTLERQSNLFLRTQNLANVGAWEYDPVEEEAHFSEMIYDIYGVDSDYDPDPETDIERFYHLDDQDTVREATRRALEEGEDYDIEVRITAADGTKKWIRTRGKPEFEDGTCKRVRGTFQDITDRKEREIDIELQRKRLTVALQGSKAGVWEWIPETDEVIFHESTERLLGLDSGTFDGTYEAFAEFVHDEDIGTLEATVTEAVATKDPFDIEYRINTADNEDLWVSSRGEFVDIEGLSPRYVGVLTDVTEQKQRALELEQTKEWYRTLLDTAPDAVFVADAESGEVLETNQAATELLGRSREQILGIHRTEVDPPEQIVEYTEFFDQYIAAGMDTVRLDTNQQDIYVTTADGEQIPVEINSRTSEIDGQHLIQGYVRDISERKQREHELAESEARYRALAENFPNGAVFLFDETLEYEIVSGSGFDTIDTSATDLIGNTIYEVDPYSEEIVDTLESLMKTTLDGNIETAEITYEDRIYELHSVPIRNDDEEIIAGLYISQDITEQRQRERELERIRDFFTQAEQLGNLGAWEFDASGELVWTDGTKRIHEVENEFEPTMEDALQFFHPGDRERIEQAVETALENGEPYEREVRLITAKDNQRWVRTTGNVLLGTDQPTVRGFIQDITEQKERERELQQTNAQLENAIKAGAVGTWEWHIPDDRMVVGKEFARQFGVDPELAQEGVELEVFTSAIHEEDREHVEQEIEAAIEACGEYETEYRVWDADDELNWVLARGYVECDETGSPVRFPGVLVDITERKQIEQELQQQNNRLNEFTKIVSHDLRNPLNVVGARLELVQEDCDSEHLDAIGQAYERMNTLITDLLTLAQEGDTATDLAPIKLARHTENCWQNVDTADATLVTDFGHTIRADRSKLGQLFENLIRNAVEHGGESVTVTIGELDDGFYIEDDGPGIPEDERDNVFDGGYSTSQDGTGFGLKIVKQVVEAHDWEIHVTEGSAGGARFEITSVEFVDK